MKTAELLQDKKPVILSRWFDLILDTYPPDTASFLKGNKDRFANPVGQTITEGIGAVFDLVVHGTDPADVPNYLDNIIRIRAVQEFTPSDAIGFLFLLKDVIREELGSRQEHSDVLKELLVIESRIDSLVRVSFDIFMACREKLYDLKANEVRNWTCRILKNAQVVKEVPGE